MAIPDSKRRANNKWDAANMTVLGCKIRRDKAEKFKSECAAKGTSVNAVFSAAIDEFLSCQRDRVLLDLPDDLQQETESAAAAAGVSLQEFIVQAIKEKLNSWW